MILSSAAVIWIVLRLLPLATALWVVVVAAVAALVLAVLARHFLIGRYRAQRRRWAAAAESYQRFEKMLLTSRFSGLLAPLYLGVYTLDGVAVTRNNIAQALINLGRLDEAEGWLRSALQRDPLYAVPYTNLGIIAVLRRQDSHGRRHFQKAVDLGYSPAAAQQLLQRAQAKAHQLAGKLRE